MNILTTRFFNLTHRRLIKNFTTHELIHWARFKELYEVELCQGTEANPATGVFNRTTEQGQKRWDDLKKRVVEHVSCLFLFRQWF